MTIVDQSFSNPANAENYFQDTVFNLGPYGDLGGTPLDVQVEFDLSGNLPKKRWQASSPRYATGSIDQWHMEQSYRRIVGVSH